MPVDTTTMTSTKQFPFPLRVDEDHRATEFRPFTAAPPHMRAFHLAWISLFCCFFTTFSIPPLLAVIRADLGLTKSDIGTAGAASFAGAIVSRLAMGPACDLAGPRFASSALTLLTAPAVLYATAVASSPGSFAALRFLTGLSLANFTACQFWMSSMFSSRVVGRANAVAAGWANVGSGAAQLAMPLLYSSIVRWRVVPTSAAWRVALAIPVTLQAATALVVLLYGQDLPGGAYRRRVSAGKESPWGVLFHGLTNYRGWILGLTYGFGFGVELTTDNIIAEYFYDRFGMGIEAAGAIAAGFGMANWVSRPAGGAVSDELGRRYGMRGRLWGLWAVQTAAGLLCVLLGRVDSLLGSVLVMCCFSFFVQAASGLTFGVVPFVSKRSLGVISGMTGSGGTIGAVITQLLLFSGPKFSTQTGISLMGLMTIVCTLSITLIYFPQWGGMFRGPETEANLDPGDDYHILLEEDRVSLQQRMQH